MAETELRSFLETVIGEKIECMEHFSKAFVHPSCGKDNYQRLEFLGDSVISLAISHKLFFEDDSLKEGELTRLRMSLVRKEVLSKVGSELGFGRYIKLGKGEEADGGRNKESILSDVFEAFIGALYIEKGFDFVLGWIEKNMNLFIEGGKEIRDYKSLLQELLQAKKTGVPNYFVSREEGTAHRKTFYVELFIGERKISSGTGSSKKIAEQEAAKQAFQILSDEDC